MNRRRSIRLVCLGTVALALVVSPGGFSSETADREVTVDVVGDADAYLSLQYPSGHHIDLGPNVTEDVELIRLFNQFDTNFDTIFVQITDDDGPGNEPKIITGTTDAPTSLGVGDDGVIKVDIDCGVVGDTDDFTVNITASDHDVSVDLSRVIEIDCQEANTGGSNLSSSSQSNVKEISLVKFCVSDSGGGKGTGNGMAKGKHEKRPCPEQETKLVKFENEGSFELEEDDGQGVTVTPTQYKDGDEPIVVEWESTEHDITTVIVKSGPSMCRFDAPGTPIENGTVTSCGLQN